MKNKILLLMGTLSVIAVTFIGTIVGYGNVVNASASSSLSDKEYEEELKRNWDIAVLADSIEKIIDKKYNIVDRFNDTYPSYFGGMYASDDSTELIIQVVKDNIPKEDSDDYKIYNDIVTYDEKVKIAYVDYSFNELNQANNEISDFMTSNNSNLSKIMTNKKSMNLVKNNIIGTYIDVMNNTVMVELETEENTVQQEFKNSVLNNIDHTTSEFTHELISFKKGEIASPYVDLHAGSGIENGCSMGFRTKRNGAIGYVTAGHCVEGKKSVESGLVIDYHFGNNQNYDYAFIQTKSNYNLTNKLAYPGKNITKLAVVNYCPVLSVNLKIAKSANKTKYSEGKITGLNQTQKFKKEDGTSVTIKGLVKSNLKATLGDSGGTVMIPKTDSQGGAVAIGVISGGGKSGFLNLSYDTYFTDITNMSMNLQARY